MDEWMSVESRQTDEGIEYKVSMPAPRIVEMDYPYFVVEWMGKRMKGKVITRNCVQIGDKLLFREG